MDGRRLASSFNSIFNGPMPTLPIGRAFFMASVCFLWIPQEPLSPRDLGQGPSSVQRIWWGCADVCLERQKGATRNWWIGSENSRAEGKRNEEIKENWRQGGSDWYRALRTWTWVLLRKVNLDERSSAPHQMPSAICINTKDPLLGHRQYTLQLRAAKGGVDWTRNQQRVKQCNVCGVCLWHLC